MIDRIAAIRELLDGERLGADVVFVEGPAVGTRAVIEHGVGVIAGSIPEAVEARVLADADEVMAAEESRTIDHGEHRVFISTIAPPPVLVIFGAGHVSQPLARFAKHLGYRVVVVDARARWATRERFPEVDELIVGWPDAFFDDHELDQRTFVAVMSHDPRFEEPVFSKLRGAPVRYIGAMGSRRTARDRAERLAADGWQPEDIDRIHGPIGLDLGDRTPEETAIAILAEITRARYGRRRGTSSG